MNIAILIFSPKQSTYELGKQIERTLKESHHQVHFYDTTKKKIIWQKRDYKSFFDTIEKHDLLFVGAPVYGYFNPQPFLNFLRYLPEPDTTWGQYTIPFVTYGGVTSGIALYNMGKILQATGRKNIYGMRINTFHSLTRELKYKININRPGKEEDSVIEKCISEINGMDNLQKCEDKTDKFQYQKNTIISNIAHTSFPEPEFTDLCKKCKRCEMVCPLNRISIQEKGALITEKAEPCIACFECYYACKHNAVIMPKERINAFLETVATGKYVSKEILHSALI